MIYIMVRVSKTFRELRELVRIVSESGPQEWSIVSLKAIAKSQSPYAQLFRVLKENPELNEAQVLRSIVPVHDDTGMRVDHIPSALAEERTRKTKSRLKARLLNSLFVLNLTDSAYSAYSQTLFKVNRTVFLSRVLTALGARVFAVSMARTGLARAMEIEEWVCALELLKILRSNAVQSGEVKAYKVYVEQSVHCQRLIEAEEIASGCVEGLQIVFAKSGGEKPEHAQAAAAAAEIAARMSKQFPSFKLSFISVRLRAMATQLQMNYADTISVCDEAFALLNQYPIFSNHSRNGEFALMGLISSVQGRNGEASSLYIELCQKHLDKGKNNWLNFKEFHYLHLMQKLEFQEANNIVREVMSNSRYSMQTEAVHDRWNLFQLYAEFTTGARVPITKADDFAVLVQSFAADKAGLNTAMILLHVLLLAERKQFGELRDRIEFIRGYRKPHLKGPENSQMNRLFRMLELIETCDLHYIKILRRSRALLEDLKKAEESEPIQGEQILPATWIWNRLMEQLREYRPVNARTS
jgi:hypothetical protein